MLVFISEFGQRSTHVSCLKDNAKNPQRQIHCTVCMIEICFTMCGGRRFKFVNKIVWIYPVGSLPISSWQTEAKTKWVTLDLETDVSRKQFCYLKMLHFVSNFTGVYS